MYSAGYYNDMAYVVLAYGLLSASEEVESGGCANDGITLRQAPYKENKQISRRISTLKDELLNFIHSRNHTQRRVEPKKMRLYSLLLIKAQDKEVQLDYLALWLLFLRFQPNERTKLLHEDFTWLSNKEGTLLQTIDILNKLPIKKKDTEMFNLATKLMEEL